MLKNYISNIFLICFDLDFTYFKKYYTMFNHFVIKTFIIKQHIFFKNKQINVKL